MEELLYGVPLDFQKESRRRHGSAMPLHARRRRRPESGERSMNLESEAQVLAYGAGCAGQGQRVSA